MDDLFTDPGDLGFFYEEDAPVQEEVDEDLFYEPLPGEDDY